MYRPMAVVLINRPVFGSGTLEHVHWMDYRVENNRICPVVSFGINYSSPVYPAKWLNKAYMSYVRFWHKVLKPVVSSNNLDKLYMHYIRFLHWALQPLLTYMVLIILYNRLTVQKVDLFAFPIERAHSNWPGGILNSKTPKSGHIWFLQYTLDIRMLPEREMHGRRWQKNLEKERPVCIVNLQTDCVDCDKKLFVDCHM